MRSSIVAIALLAAACTQTAEQDAPTQRAAAATSDAAGNRIESLTQLGPAQCSADGVWCLEIANGAALVRRDGALTATIALEGEGAFVAWPSIVRVGDSALVGVMRTTEQMYAGGAGSASLVTLYEVSGPAPTAVLTAPASASISIRACFNEEDVAARRNACADQYEFAGALGLDAGVSRGAPRFVLTTEATTYPGVRNRFSDSSHEPPLQESDLRRVRDEACSYHRLARRDGVTYVWDAPLPDCSMYLEP